MFYRPSFKGFDLVTAVRKTADLPRELMAVSKGPSEATLHPEGLLNPLAKSEKQWLDSVNVISLPSFLIPKLLEGGFRSPRDDGSLHRGDVVS